jgi:hypothetical protein
MHKSAKGQQFKPKYQYVTTEVEAAYMIKRNPDPEKFKKLNDAVLANNHFCPARTDKVPENKCMCKQFLNRDSEGFCKYKLFYKEARTKKAAEAYLNAEVVFNEKKEKEIEKQFEKEQKVKLEDEE